MKNLKVKFIFFLFCCFAFLIIFKLYNLQIKNGDYFEALALGQQIDFPEISGERGEIFFNKGEVPLAQTEEKNIAYIFPGKIPEQDLEKTLEILSDILAEKKENLVSLFEKEKVFKRELSKENYQKIESLHLNGVSLDKIWVRNYPQKNLASHVLGFLNQEGKGQYGIEGYYDEILKGTEGFREKGRSPLGYLIFGDSSPKESSFKGADIFLTLDYNIQYLSEKLLLKAKENWDIDSGQIIALEPSTGEILALAVFPGFDPNHYSKEKSLEIFLNSSFQKLFEPGSVFKPITFASALEENLISPETTYEDEGLVELGGPPIYNFEKRVWNTQTMTDVLEESINTGAVFVQQELGRNLFLNYLEKFGLFEKTEIDLQAEEFSLNKTLKSGYPRDIATASFGQGIELTPFQLVRAFGAIANGGNLMKPHIVKKIVKTNNQVIETEPEIQRKVISEATSAELISMLVSVVENGSGRRAKINGYDIAGKTGTAQVPQKEKSGYSETESIQSFVGFLPASEPEILIFLKLDNPKGVKTAAYSAVPLFRELAKYIIDYWQISPNMIE